MRWLIVLIVVLSGALPAWALAHNQDRDDGTLLIRNAEGTITLRFTGSLIGRFADGTLRDNDPMPSDDSGLTVWGADDVVLIPPTASIYTGRHDVRFRALGGVYSIRIRASSLSLSAVGTGKVTLSGTSGSYALNGGSLHALPGSPIQLAFGG